MQILPPLTAVLRGGFSFGEVPVLAKPPNIANDSFKSAKRDELTAGRSFTTSDAPARVLLYGGNVGFDFGATELIEYKAGGFHGR